MRGFAARRLGVSIRFSVPHPKLFHEPALTRCSAAHQLPGSRAGRRQDEGRHNREAKGCVEHGENPRFRAIKENPVSPVSDEIARVGDLTGPFAKPPFPHGQGARNSGERFGNHDSDHGDVGVAEPRVADPSPAKRNAGQDGHEPEDDEAHIRGVGYHEHIREDPAPEHRRAPFEWVFKELNAPGPIIPFQKPGVEELSRFAVVESCSWTLDVVYCLRFHESISRSSRSAIKGRSPCLMQVLSAQQRQRHSRSGTREISSALLYSPA